VTGQLKTERIGNFLVLDLGTHKVYGIDRSLIREISVPSGIAEPCENQQSVYTQMVVRQPQPLADRPNDTCEPWRTPNTLP